MTKILSVFALMFVMTQVITPTWADAVELTFNITFDGGQNNPFSSEFVFNTGVQGTVASNSAAPLNPGAVGHFGLEGVNQFIGDWAGGDATHILLDYFRVSGENGLNFYSDYSNPGNLAWFSPWIGSPAVGVSSAVIAIDGDNFTLTSNFYNFLDAKINGFYGVGPPCLTGTSAGCTDTDLWYAQMTMQGTVETVDPSLFTSGFLPPNLPVIFHPTSATIIDVLVPEPTSLVLLFTVLLACWFFWGHACCGSRQHTAHFRRSSKPF